MNRKDQAAVQDSIERVFERHDVRFVPLKNFLNLLENDERQNLGLKKTSSQDAVKSALSPLPPAYQFTKFKNSVYLWNGSPEEGAIDFIRLGKGKTFKQLNARFPMPMDRFLEIVNRLIDQGAIKARLSKTAQPLLHVADTTTEPASSKSSGRESVRPKPEKLEQQNLSDVEIFKKAYDAAGKGANYVFIHEIRKLFSWPRERFDRLLFRLMTEGYVAAHPGNPGALTAEEVNDSFQDEFGDLYITVTWRKPYDGGK